MKSARCCLRSFINGRNILDEDFKRVLYNILCAVHFLHSSNIIHRDLKPDNILINSEGVLQLCDFGMARTLPQSAQGKHNGNSVKVRKSVLNTKGTKSIDLNDTNSIKQRIASKLKKIH